MCVTFSICFLGFGHALFEWVVWETKPKKDGDFGQMNYDDSSIWIETIGLEKLRPLFISQCEFNSLCRSETEKKFLLFTYI